MNTISNLENVLNEMKSLHDDYVSKTELLECELNELKKVQKIKEEAYSMNEEDFVCAKEQSADDHCVDNKFDDLRLSKAITNFIGIDSSRIISSYFGNTNRFIGSLRGIVILNKMTLNKRSKQNILYLVDLIKSGDIVSNYSTLGATEEFLNARFIHRALPKKFADRWAFNTSSITLFKALLDNAKILYSIGESVKHIDSRAERERKCEELWKEYISSEKKEDDMIVPNNEIVESYRELQQNEQRIVICGKQFWPVTQFSFNQNPERTYAVVWGAGTFLEQLIGLLLSKGDTIESVAVWLMQNSRSLRLMTKEGAAVFHSMVSVIKSNPELFKDNNKTILPVTTSAPEGY